MFGRTSKTLQTEAVAVAEVAVVEKPILRPPPSFVTAKRTTDADLGEYATIAKEVGVDVPQLVVEGFLAVLEKLNYPIYSRAEVVAYMDEKAKKDGTGLGWEWRPVRDKDHIPDAWFGTAARHDRFSDEPRPASDYYANSGTNPMLAQLWAMNQTRTPTKYDKLIPLHALQRIAAIEREYKKPAHFMVSDYATQPHIRPDPFLMVVISGVPSDAGRFIIDFWDEPGFGIDKMLK